MTFDEYYNRHDADFINHTDGYPGSVSFYQFQSRSNGKIKAKAELLAVFCNLVVHRNLPFEAVHNAMMQIDEYAELALHNMCDMSGEIDRHRRIFTRTEEDRARARNLKPAA